MFTDIRNECFLIVTWKKQQINEVHLNAYCTSVESQGMNKGICLVKIVHKSYLFFSQC